MRLIKEIIIVVLALLLVLLLTFLPQDIQNLLIYNVGSALNIVMANLAPSMTFFDPAMLASNLGHVITFCVLGYVVGKYIRILSLYFIITMLMMFAVGSEMSQFFVVGREPSISDLVLNISAVLTGFLVSNPASRPKRKAEEY